MALEEKCVDSPMRLNDRGYLETPNASASLAKWVSCVFPAESRDEAEGAYEMANRLLTYIGVAVLGVGSANASSGSRKSMPSGTMINRSTRSERKGSAGASRIR